MEKGGKRRGSPPSSQGRAKSTKKSSSKNQSKQSPKSARGKNGTRASRKGKQTKPTHDSQRDNLSGETDSEQVHNNSDVDSDQIPVQQQNQQSENQSLGQTSVYPDLDASSSAAVHPYFATGLAPSGLPDLASDLVQKDFPTAPLDDGDDEAERSRDENVNSEGDHVELEDEDESHSQLQAENASEQGAQQLTPIRARGGRAKRGSTTPRARGGPRGRPRGSSMGRGMSGVTRLGLKRQGALKGEGARGGAFRGKKPGARFAEPTPAFRTHQAAAYRAFFQKDYDTAEENAKRAIQENPEIFAAHSLLSEIYQAKDMRKESFDSLWAGAHTRRDNQVWRQVAKRIVEIGDPDQENLENNIIYCMDQIIHINKDDVEAHKRKAEICLKRTDADSRGKAFRAVRHVTRIEPGNLRFVHILTDLAFANSDLRSAKQAFEACIAHHRRIQDTEEDGEFSWTDLTRYLSLLYRLKLWEEGILKTKTACRWLDGRKADSTWDIWTMNDAEFDVEDEPRRVKIPHFIKGSLSEASRMMPSDVRAKLGLFRLRFGEEIESQAQIDEALHHFSLVGYPSPDSLDEFSKLFRIIADRLYQVQQYQQALNYYEPLVKAGMKMDSDDRVQIAKACEKTSRPHDAVEMWEIIVQQEPKNVDARIELALLYEYLQRPAEAYTNVTEAVRLKEEDERARFEEMEKRVELLRGIARSEAAKTGAIPREIPSAENYKTPAASRLLKPGSFLFDFDGRGEKKKLQLEYIKNLYERMQSLRPALHAMDEDAVEEWRRHAAILIKDFKSTKLFFPWDKNKKFSGYGKKAAEESSDRQTVIIEKMVHKLRATLEGSSAGQNSSDQSVDEAGQDEEVPDEYKSIKFTDWLHIFCEYAFVSAKCDDSAEAYKTLETASQANVFHHDIEHKFHIHLTWLTCGMILNEEETIFTQARWFCRELPDTADTFCLYSALARLYPHESEFLFGPVAQKFAVSQVRAMDYALMTDEQRTFFGYGPGGRRTRHHRIREDNRAPQEVGEDDDDDAQHDVDDDVDDDERQHDFDDEESDDSQDVVVELENPASEETMEAIRRFEENYGEDDEDLPSPSEDDPSDQPNPFQGVELDPHVLALCAHMSAAVGTYRTSLNYYFRAWATVRGGNPLLALCVAVAYVQLALQPRVSNRHYYIMLAQGFMGEYERERMDMLEEHGADRNLRRVLTTEVEFNKARMWQLMGLNAEAIRGYEKCLATSEKFQMEEEDEALGGEDGAQAGGSKDAAGANTGGTRATSGSDAKGKGPARDTARGEEFGGDDEGGEGETQRAGGEKQKLPDYSREAAHALQGLLVVAGETNKAREIVMKWLVV